MSRKLEVLRKKNKWYKTTTMKTDEQIDVLRTKQNIDITGIKAKHNKWKSNIPFFFFFLNNQENLIFNKK